MTIYLASQSPRRRELLQQIGVAFEVLPVSDAPHLQMGVDETPHPNESPCDYVQRVCLDKANAGWNTLLRRPDLPRLPILAADTTVALDNAILGKPADAAEAADMLRRLSGRKHEVLTAIAITFENRTETRLSITTVDFIALDEDCIQRYIASGEGTDKAGGYAIQGRAGAFARHLDGSYSGVMGLPLAETVELLRAFGYDECISAV
jgi:septum formation protein